MRWNVSRGLRWALPLSLLGLLVVLGLGASLLGWRLPGNHFMLVICALWVVFGVTRALYTDALMQESQKRQQLIELLDSTRRDLAQEERRAGVLMERQRLSRDLHDTFAQSFTGIVLHLEAAEQALPSQIELTRRHIDQARAAARGSLSEVRRLLSALRPGLLEKTSLAEAAQRVVQSWNEEQLDAATVAELSLSPLGWLHPEVEVTLLRAIQESLSNVQKHAQARRVAMRLERDERGVSLTVTDDGVGFPEAGLASAAVPGGYGLLAMRERVAELGGELRLTQAPDGGAQVSLRLPVRGEVDLVVDSSPGDKTSDEKTPDEKMLKS